FQLLDISNTEVWEFFTLEGSSIEKLILGEPRVTSLWALTKVHLNELVVIKPNDHKIPANLIQSLKKLTVKDARTIILNTSKRSRLEELDLSGSKLQNPNTLLRFVQLKKLTIDKDSLKLDLINELKKRGVEVLQSNSSLNR
ncbi:MAG: hypothetical protein NE328_13040, partial [Lentisphaeraceae bacterium]|nr:hypothetical protein [Lentisphaeraceae bacterium]